MSQDKNIKINSHRTLINELDGYDLMTSPTLPATDTIRYEKERGTTNTSGEYSIMQNEKRVGHAALSFALRDKEVYFDISISEQGQNLGSTALSGLAETSRRQGLNLITGGIMSSSKDYWRHLAERGDVVALDPTNPDTQYRAIPHLTEPKKN